jgi:phosphatidylglycerophosphate synthase
MQALPAMSYRSSDRHASTDILLSGTALACFTLLLGAAAAGLLGLGMDFVLRAAVGFCIATAGIWLLALRAPNLPAFGAANRITLLRVVLLALVAAAFGEAPKAALSWTIIVVVTLALILDGVDGRVARQTRTTSSFGARFDMETDAALIMILSLLCWQFGKAGIWILAAGGMRYGFVLAARALPWMRAPLPPSRRRQAVCIWQSACLLGVISPLFPVPASELLAAATLVMLSTSFAIDIRWLWARHCERRTAHGWIR